VVSTPGTVIQGRCLIDGALICNAANVVFRDSKINIHRGWGIVAKSGCTGLRVDRVEIDCNHVPGTNGFAQDFGRVGQNIELRDMNIHGCENGVFIDNGVRLFNSFIHDPLNDGLSDAHSDGVQLWAGASDVVVQGNVIDYRGNTTSAFMSCCARPDPNFGFSDHVLVANNLFGGGAATIYLPNSTGGPRGQVYANVRFINNRFMQNAFAFFYCSGFSSEMTEWRSNVVNETGAPIRCA
jgi:Right handed beta helix region